MYLWTEQIPKEKIVSLQERLDLALKKHDNVRQTSDINSLDKNYRERYIQFLYDEADRDRERQERNRAFNDVWDMVYCARNMPTLNDPKFWITDRALIPDEYQYIKGEFEQRERMLKNDMLKYDTEADNV